MTSRLATRLAPFLALGATVVAQTSKNTSKGGAAPEIDVALGAAAFALVIGGLLILTAVRRKRLARS